VSTQAAVRPEGITVHPRPDRRHAPAVLVLPGGGYARQAPHEAEPVAEWLASLGLHAFILRYKVAPHRHPEPLIDAKQAMTWIRSGAHGLPVDPARVGVLGFSAGGHLAASLATALPTGEPDLDTPAAVPDLSVLCYPVISFTASPHLGSVENLLGQTPPDALLQLHSTERQVTAETPPAFLWHTEDDAAVSARHSVLYAEALRVKGVDAELHLFPSGRHGLGLAGDTPGASAWPELCEEWLERRGWIG
jgi:acetyl esterase/lipase